MPTAVSKANPQQGVRFTRGSHPFNSEDYFINPVLPECAKKYWKTQDDEVVEMTDEEKAVVDESATE